MQPLDFLLGRYLGIRGFGFTVERHDHRPARHRRRAGDRGRRRARTPTTPPSITRITASARGCRRPGPRAANPRLANQNGITNAALFADDYQQWDFSSSLDLSTVFGSRHLPQLTFDVVNIFKAKQRSYFQFENAAFTSYNPGRTVMIGLRGRF